MNADCRDSMKRSNQNGFTLIELLVVISIIVVLMALLLPAIFAAREAALAAQCKSNLRQIGTALHSYHHSHEYLPAGWTAATPEGTPGWGWASAILIELEQRPLYETQLQRNLPISDPANQTAREHVIPVLICPTDHGRRTFTLGAGHGGGHAHDDGHEDHDEHEGPHSVDAGPPLFLAAKSNYPGVFGTMEIEDAPSAADGIFFHNSRITFNDVRDGLTNTVFVGERSSRFGGSLWQGVVPEADAAMARIVGVGDHAPNDPHHHFDDFSSEHRGGVHFVFGDNSVRMLSEKIDLKVYQGMCTRAGGEIPSEP